MSAPSPTERFSNRVENYVRYRPTYPAAVLDILHREIGLAPEWSLADVGSGTGISAELFLKHGNKVFAVEPNGPMRAAAERLLASYRKFHSIDGTAEATTLRDRSVDAVIAAQAFHWFDHVKTGVECRRILKADRWAVLLWNTRRIDSTPFLRDYERLLKKYGTDYAQVRHENVDQSRLDPFYGAGNWRKRNVDNEQRFTLDGLRGRALSSSYVPADGDPGQAAMLTELDELFAKYEQSGQVVIEYDTEIYFGQMT